MKLARGLRPRLVWGFVAVSVTTGIVTAVAVIAGVLVLASRHPIGANRVGGDVIAACPPTPPRRRSSGRSSSWAS